MSSFHAANVRFFFFFFPSSQIATAVRFLQNQQVRQSPLATRKAFLKKKGEYHQYVPEPNVKYCVFTGRYKMAQIHDSVLKFNQLNAFVTFFRHQFSKESLFAMSG